VASTTTSPNLKNEVAQFWNGEPCGTRYLGAELDFESHADARYALEPAACALSEISTPGL